MSQEEVNRKLSCILSADAVGYSRLMEENEASTVRYLEENKRLIARLIEEHNGRVVDSTGDNLLAEFSSAVKAVDCAVKIQKELKIKNAELVENRRMQFRIGINLGDVIEEGGRLYGSGVNIASRLEGLAEPGGVCISNTAYDQVKSKIHADYDYLGEYQVKNINEPVKVYRILTGGESTEKYVPPIHSQNRMIPLRIAIISFIILLATAVATTIAVLYPKPAKPLQVMRFDLELPEGLGIRTYRAHFFAIAPDGTKFVYCTAQGLYLHSFDDVDASLIRKTDDLPMNPVFSPNGKWIAYSSQKDDQLKKISVSGGPPVPLADALVWSQLNWYDDNTILYGSQDTIWKISADGGNPESLLKVEGGLIGNPQMLPDGNTIMFTDITGGLKTILHSLKSGESKVLLEGGVSARYLRPGYIVYSMDSTLYALRFNIDTMEKTGWPVSLEENVMTTSSSISQYDVSDFGTLIYATEAISMADRRKVLMWVDRGGNEEVLAADSDFYQSVKISHDGKKVALVIREESNENIWIWDVDLEKSTKLTFDDTDDSSPLWAADDMRIIFRSNRDGSSGVYWKAASGAGRTETLFLSEDELLFPFSLSANGDIMTLVTISKSNLAEQNISTLFLNNDRELKNIMLGKTQVRQPMISPDGRWLAYVSMDEGPHIYVVPFPDVKDSGKWLISKDGGHSPLWSSDGRELFYRNGNKAMAVTVEAEPTFKASKPEAIFEGPYLSRSGGNDSSRWDIHPDGKRFLMIKPIALKEGEDGIPASPKLKIVLNWFEELKDRVPVD